jgi:hypothetical protein
MVTYLVLERFVSLMNLMKGNMKLLRYGLDELLVLESELEQVVAIPNIISQLQSDVLQLEVEITMLSEGMAEDEGAIKTIYNALSMVEESIDRLCVIYIPYYGLNKECSESIAFVFECWKKKAISGHEVSKWAKWLLFELSIPDPVDYLVDFLDYDDDSKNFEVIVPFGMVWQHDDSDIESIHSIATQRSIGIMSFVKPEILERYRSNFPFIVL